ncbi:MAG TPA: ABC transporter permease [Gammaproteobacteria bacterium]|nr:ABC transporter permease [Gammaproteobacteria bacterium]
MIALYVDRQSWMHRLSAGSKLLVLCVSSMLMLPVDSLPVLSAFLLCVLALYLSAGREMFARIALLRPVLPFLAIIGLLHVLAGSYAQAGQVLIRLIAMLLLANLVTLTTRMRDMMTAMTPLFRPLAPLGLSPRRLSLAVALMVRFAPVLLATMEALTESWRARSSRNPRWRLLAPFTLQALRMAETVGEALQARGGVAVARERVSRS